MARIAIIAFTRAGCELALRLSRGLRDDASYAQAETTVHGPERFAGADGVEAYESLEAWTQHAFAEARALVFVGACGIAVRAIAPHVRDKFSDPAVVSVDEAGRFAVPLLSGHVGGANELARAVAALLGGQAAVSTATDVNGLFAVDEWAARNGLRVVERAVAKQISARLLEGGAIGFASELDVAWGLPQGVAGAVTDLGFAISYRETYSPFAATLHLVPPPAVVGVGCRRETEPAVLVRAVGAALEAAHVPASAVAHVASIDVKRDEPAIRALAAEHGWALRFYSAEELACVPGEFASSAFVERTVGVDNVCERAALAQGGRMLLGKQAREGTTVAVAMGPPS